MKLIYKALWLITLPNANHCLFRAERNYRYLAFNKAAIVGEKKLVELLGRSGGGGGRGGGGGVLMMT